MSRTTLDIIGLAGTIIPLNAATPLLLRLKFPGFNYKFNALTDDPEKNELMKSFSTILKAGEKPTVIPKIRALCPSLRFLVRTAIHL